MQDLPTPPSPPLPAASAYSQLARQFFRLALNDLHHTAELIGSEAALDGLRGHARGLHVGDGSFGAHHELAEAATWFVTTWHEGAARIADEVETLADAVHRAGSDYQACDADAAAALRGVSGRVDQAGPTSPTSPTEGYGSTSGG